jgi:hypothetical protein
MSNPTMTLWRWRPTGKFGPLSLSHTHRIGIKCHQRWTELEKRLSLTSSSRLHHRHLLVGRGAEACNVPGRLRIGGRTLPITGRISTRRAQSMQAHACPTPLDPVVSVDTIPTIEGGWMFSLVTGRLSRNRPCVAETWSCIPACGSAWAP